MLISFSYILQQNLGKKKCKTKNGSIGPKAQVGPKVI